MVQVMILLSLLTSVSWRRNAPSWSLLPPCYYERRLFGGRDTALGTTGAIHASYYEVLPLFSDAFHDRTKKTETSLSSGALTKHLSVEWSLNLMYITAGRELLHDEICLFKKKKLNVAYITLTNS